MFGMLKSSTGLEPPALSRFAICLSLRQEGVPNPSEYNKNGSEFSSSTLFGEYEQLYLALIIQRLVNDKLDPETYLDDMVRSHLNRGAIGLRQRIRSISDFARLLRI